MRRAGDMLGRTWAGWRVGDAMALIWGHRGDVAASGTPKSRLVNALMHRRTVLNAYDMDDKAIAAYVGLLKREQPGLILGYASSLAFIAEYVARHGITGLAPKGIISSAEALSPERRAAISATFKCPVYDRYGSREFANIAQQCEQLNGLHVFADRVHVEVLRPDGSECAPGERGEIVVTDFFNGAMPFIRYRTGDLGACASKPCSCGRGLPLLESVEGRVTEIIVGPNGKYYACPGPVLLASGIPGIVQMQVVQDRISAIEVRVAPGAEWTQSSRELLVARVRELLGDVEVSITMVDRIPPAASGKHQFVISTVSPFSRPGAGA